MTTTETRRSSKLRSVVAGLAGVLAVVALLGSVLAVWTHSVLFDSKRVGETVGRSLDDPQVTAALANYITTQVFVVVDVDNVVGNVLPLPLQRLRPAIVGGAFSFVSTRVDALLSTDAAQTVVTKVVQRSHAAMVKLLKGDGLVDGLSVKNGEVTANLLPLVSRGLVAAQGIGLFDNVNVPVLTADGAPTDQIAQLEKAFGRDLPADFGQLVVYRSDRLAAASASLSTAQRAVTLFERAVIAIVVLTLLLGAAAIWMARGRRRAIIALALGSGAALLLARALIRRVVEDVPAIIVNPGARAATVTTLSGLAGGLIQLTTLLIVGTVIVAVGMFLQGDSSVAGRIRHSLSAGTDSVGGIMSEHRSGVAIAFFGLAVGVIAVAGISLVTMIVALVLAGAGAWFLRARPQPVADPV